MASTEALEAWLEDDEDERRLVEQARADPEVFRRETSAALRRSRHWSLFWGSDADLVERGSCDLDRLLEHAPITQDEDDREAVAHLRALAEAVRL